MTEGRVIPLPDGVLARNDRDEIIAAIGAACGPPETEEAIVQKSIEESQKALTKLIEIRGESKWIAGDRPTLADFYVAPICFYVSLTENAGKVFDVPGFADWWERMRQLECFGKTEPDLG